MFYDIVKKLKLKAQKRPLYMDGVPSYSVTELIAPPFMVKQMRENPDVRDESPDAVVASAIGSLCHLGIASIMNDGDKILLEKKMSVRLDDAVVYGTADMIDVNRGRIVDFKFSKSTRVKDEWVSQVVMYAALAYEDLFLNVEEGMIVHINPLKGSVDEIVFNVKPEDGMKLLMKRLSLHLSNNPDVCSPEERWEKWTNGNRVYVRCEKYCPIRSICTVCTGKTLKL